MFYIISTGTKQGFSFKNQRAIEQWINSKNFNPNQQVLVAGMSFPLIYVVYNFMRDEDKWPIFNKLLQLGVKLTARVDESTLVRQLITSALLKYDQKLLEELLKHDYSLVHPELLKIQQELSSKLTPAKQLIDKALDSDEEQRRQNPNSSSADNSYGLSLAAGVAALVAFSRWKNPSSTRQNAVSDEETSLLAEEKAKKKK